MSVVNEQDNELYNNKLIDLENVSVNRNSNSDKELSNKNCVDGSIGEGTIVRFIQTLDNYLKVSVGNDTNNLTTCDKKNKLQIQHFLNILTLEAIYFNNGIKKAMIKAITVK